MAAVAPVQGDPGQGALPTGLKAGWGIGSVGTQVVLFSQSALLLYFFSAVLGLEPAVAGGLLFAAKLFDAALAPAVGGWSDRAVTRFGRRRPFLLAGSLLSAAGLAVVFNPPAVSLPVLFAALVLISLGYSAFNIPYLAMTAEMTDSPLERTALMSWRIAFVGVGTIIATALLPMVARAGGGGAEGYGRAGLVAAVLVLLTMGIAFLATRGARATASRGERHSLAEMVRAVASNRAFAWLLFAKLLQLVGLAASSASMLYFFKAVIGGDEKMLAITGAVSNGVSILSLAFWPALGKRYGKVPLYALSVVGFALVGFSWLLAGPGTTLAGVVARAAASGVFVGGLLLMGQSLIPDAIALDHERTGLRREGVFAGAYSFVEKGSSALGPMIVGGLFQLLGFSLRGPGGPPDPTAAYLAAAVIPPAAYLLSAWPALRIGRSLQAAAAARAAAAAAEGAAPASTVPAPRGVDGAAARPG